MYSKTKQIILLLFIGLSCTSLAQASLNSSMTKEFAKHYSQENWDEAKSIVFLAMQNSHPLDAAEQILMIQTIDSINYIQKLKKRTDYIQKKQADLRKRLSLNGKKSKDIQDALLSAKLKKDFFQKDHLASSHPISKVRNIQELQIFLKFDIDELSRELNQQDKNLSVLREMNQTTWKPRKYIVTSSKPFNSAEFYYSQAKKKLNNVQTKEEKVDHAFHSAKLDVVVQQEMLKKESKIENKDRKIRILNKKKRIFLVSIQDKEELISEFIDSLESAKNENKELKKNIQINDSILLSKDQQIDTLVEQVQLIETNLNDQINHLNVALDDQNLQMVKIKEMITGHKTLLTNQKEGKKTKITINELEKEVKSLFGELQGLSKKMNANQDMIGAKDQKIYVLRETLDEMHSRNKRQNKEYEALIFGQNIQIEKLKKRMDKTLIEGKVEKKKTREFSGLVRKLKEMEDEVKGLNKYLHQERDMIKKKDGKIDKLKDRLQNAQEQLQSLEDDKQSRTQKELDDLKVGLNNDIEEINIQLTNAQSTLLRRNNEFNDLDNKYKIVSGKLKKYESIHKKRIDERGKLKNKNAQYQLRLVNFEKKSEFQDESIEKLKLKLNLARMAIINKDNQLQEARSNLDSIHSRLTEVQKKFQTIEQIPPMLPNNNGSDMRSNIEDVHTFLRSEFFGDPFK